MTAKFLTRIWVLLLAVVGLIGPTIAQLGSSQQASVGRGSPCVCNGCPGSETQLVKTAVFQGRPPSGSPPGTINVEKFDPSLGQLVKVQYDAKIELPFAQARFENTNPVAGCQLLGMVFNLSFLVRDPFGANMTFGPTSNPASVFDCSQTFGSGIALAPFDQAPGSQPDFVGPSATQITCPTATQSTRISNPISYCSDRNQLDTFRNGGGNTVPFQLSTIASQSQSTTCSNLASSFVSQVKITITITYTYCPNRPPEGTPDFATTCAGTLVDIPVLANDCDTDGKIDCSSITIVDPPDHAANVVVAGCTGISSLTGCPQANNCPGCKVSYTPAAGYNGPDSFTYTVEDDDGCVSEPVLVTITVNAGPNAVNESVTTCKDAPVVIGILANDVPAGGTTLNCGSVFITDQPDHGTLALNVACGGVGNGGCNSSCVRYTPTAGYAGPDSFTYRVTDSQGCTDTAVVSITVRAGPAAGPDSATTCQDTPVVIGVLQNDVPAGGATLNCGSVAITDQPDHGTLALNIACGGAANGGCNTSCVRYTPTAGYNGPDSFQYTVTDSTGCTSNPAIVAITVNAPPNAVNDNVATCENQPVVIGILSNDVAAATTQIVCNSVFITDQPDHGTLSLNFACGGVGNGGCNSNCVQYTPTNGYSGPDNFSYRITDNRGCTDTALVTITVRAGPTAGPDTATTCQDTPVIIGILQNDVPEAGSTLTCNSVTITDQPDHGTLTLNLACGGAPNGGCNTNCVRYTPTAGYNGPDSFQYTVNDSNGCTSNPATVGITVNAPPNAVNDTIATCKNQPVVIGILSNDVAAATTQIVCNSVFITDQPDHGTLALNFACGGVGNGGCNSNCVQYTPTNGYSGPDNFSYRITDNRGCTDTALVTITVRAGPTAGPDTATTCQDTPVILGILQNDTPEAGSTLTCNSVTITDQPDHGTLTLNLACGGAPNGGCNTSCVRYTPTAGYNGPDSFQYTVNDSNGCTSNPATVGITVNAPPNAVNDTIATCRNQPVIIGILSNDVPAATTTIVCNSVTITDQPDHGTLALNFACGGAPNGGCNSNCVQYTPTNGYSGPDGFTYSITDSRGCTDTAVVTITVRAGPTAGPDNATTCQDTPVIVGILQNDVPEAGSTLTCNSVTITDQPDHGTLTLNLACGGAPNGGCNTSCVRYTPTAGYNGPDSFQYTVNDSNGCTSNPATVAITVNAPPNAVNDNAATCKNEPVVIGILSNDVPAATTTIVCNSVTITDQPDHGTVALNFACGGAPNGGCNSNCVQYTPTNGYSGPDSFTYRITDSRGCTDTAVVSVTVRAGPTAGPDNATTCQDTPVIVGILQNDTPEAGSTLTCNSVTITDQPDHGTLTLNLACGGAPNGGCNTSCVRYTPTAGYNGPDSFQYTVDDSNGCTSNAATVAITINALPNAANDNVSTCRNSPVVIGILANDVPAATTTLVCSSVLITDQPDHGTVALNIACGGAPNGSCASNCVRYTPTNGYTGPDSFTYSITDSRGCIDTAVVSITVRAGPAAGPDTGTTCQDEPVIVGILSNDVPEDGSTLTCNSVVITDQPDHGTVALNIACGGVGNGSCGSNCVRYTPTAGYNGPDSFQYTVNDSNGCTSSPATVTITVNAPPNAVNDNVSTCRNSPVVIGILQNDVPAATTTFVCNSVVITDQPDHGTLALNVACGGVTNRGCTANCVRYTPTTGYVGPDSFTYSITDSRGCKDTAVVQIRVCAPIALPDASEVCQLQSVSINVLANDSGQESCGVINCGSITIVDPPDFGVAVPNAGCNGSAPCGSCRVVYSHNDPDHIGPDSFTYTVKDSSGCVSLPVTVTIQVKPAPRVLDRKIIKDPASSAPITNIPVLDGATPGQGCTLVASTLTIVSPPSFGQAVVNPNGTITYTPGGNFPEEDTFCFRVQNSCGCTDEGCVEINEPPITCIERNRLQCGSLLLFPEFSTRPGEQTMYTITDACCNSQGTYIEIIFIKEGTCLEENRTFFLTPCDTLTLVTNFAVGPNQRGYAYAYAKSGPAPGATPTVFNHLVGDLLFLDGNFQAQYAINAVSFKGIGLEGSFNDEDNDGVLDLDGLTEYEEAPDELYIPRFLGETADFHSELILIALSGGTAFKSNGGTEIGIRMFDDNENAFSIGHEFYCWAKPRLLEISGAFAQSFLHNVGGPIDDPDEIFGWQGRESGWFSINGLFAHSTAETIVDPAVYAVLVEHWGNRAAAELPFEFCSQTNADLLPNSVFGDPRPGAPSGLPDDNQ